MFLSLSLSLSLFLSLLSLSLSLSLTLSLSLSLSQLLALRNTYSVRLNRKTQLAFPPEIRKTVDPGIVLWRHPSLLAVLDADSPPSGAPRTRGRGPGIK